MSSDYIHTFSGTKFHFLEPNENEIHIEDIAHALSMLCRYSGHVTKFYSVAEHCVLLAKFTLQKLGKDAALYALLHDASEAYLVDIPRPIKSHLVEYKHIETWISKCIYDKFNINRYNNVDLFDYHIVADESVLLNGDIGWVSDYIPIGVTVQCWTPAKAEEEFLALFTLLRKQNEQ